MKKKTTEELMQEITTAFCIEDFLNHNSSEMIHKKLHEYMRELLTRQGLRKKDVIQGSCLNRSYVYQIFLGLKLPSRNKVIALAFGFCLSLQDTQNFLRQAGYRELYARDKRDTVIIFAMNRGLDLMQTNQLLYEQSESIIE